MDSLFLIVPTEIVASLDMESVVMLFKTSPNMATFINKPNILRLLKNKYSLRGRIFDNFAQLIKAYDKTFVTTRSNLYMGDVWCLNKAAKIGSLEIYKSIAEHTLTPFDWQNHLYNALKVGAQDLADFIIKDPLNHEGSDEEIYEIELRIKVESGEVTDISQIEKQEWIDSMITETACRVGNIDLGVQIYHTQAEESENNFYSLISGTLENGSSESMRILLSSINVDWDAIVYEDAFFWRAKPAAFDVLIDWIKDNAPSTNIKFLLDDVMEDIISESNYIMFEHLLQHYEYKISKNNSKILNMALSSTEPLIIGWAVEITNKTGAELSTLSIPKIIEGVKALIELNLFDRWLSKINRKLNNSIMEFVLDILDVMTVEGKDIQMFVDKLVMVIKYNDIDLVKRLFLLKPSKVPTLSKYEQSKHKESAEYIRNLQ